TRHTGAITDPNNDLLLSAATVWEIAIKVSLGKLTLSLPYRPWMNRAIADLDLALLPITVEYGEILVSLPHHHGDPFDRLLVAQALTEGIPVIRKDPDSNAYGVTRLW